MKLHHIGYAVPCIKTALKQFNLMGFSRKNCPIEDPDRNVTIAFITDGKYNIELISPLNKAITSPVDGILAKKMAGPYHLCYEVECLNDAIKKIKNLGGIVIEPASWAEALKCNVAFLFEKNLGVIEIMESKQVNG